MPITEANAVKYLLTVWVSPTVKEKIDGLAHTVAKPRSAVVRALIMQARLEDLPASWRGVSQEEREFLHAVEP